MKLQALRIAARQGLIPLPPPRDSELIEDKNILKLCLKATRLLGEIREYFARKDSPSRVGKLMLVVEAQNQLSLNQDVSLKDYFLSTIIPNPSDINLYRMENYVSACLNESSVNKKELSPINKLAEIANFFLQDNITWIAPLNIAEGSGEAPATSFSSQLKKWEIYCNNPRDLDPLIHTLMSSLYLTAFSPLSSMNAPISQIFLQTQLMRPVLGSPYPCIQLGGPARLEQSGGIIDHSVRNRNIDWQSCLSYHLNELCRSFTLTMELTNALERLFRQTRDHLLRLGLPNHVDFLPAIFEYPATRTGEFAGFTGTRRQVASHILNDYVQADILTKEENGRDKIFYNRRLIELLENDHYLFEPFSYQLERFEPAWQKGTPGRVRKEPVIDIQDRLASLND